MHEPSKTLPKLGHSCCALFTNKAFAASDQFVNPSTQPWQALTSTSTNYIQTAKGARRFVGEEVALQTGRKQNWGSKEAFFGKDGGALRWVVKQSNRLCLVVFTLGFTSMLDMYVYIYIYIYKSYTLGGANGTKKPFAMLSCLQRQWHRQWRDSCKECESLTGRMGLHIGQ